MALVIFDNNWKKNVYPPFWLFSTIKRSYRSNNFFYGKGGFFSTIKNKLFIKKCNFLYCFCSF